MISIPSSIAIFVPLYENLRPIEFTVKFTDEMLNLRAPKANDSGIRFITVCILESRFYSASPFSGVAILHPKDYHNQTVGNRLAFKRAVWSFIGSAPYVFKEKATWDKFRRAYWQANNQPIDKS
jgi:hypothetical protein